MGGETFISAVGLLLKVSQNLCNSKDAKFRSLNLQKQVLQERIGQYTGAVQVLEALGFREGNTTVT